MNEDSATESLLLRAERGDAGAVERLLAAQRSRLRRMIVARCDRRLSRRIDPSDVVQDVLLRAHRLLPDYLASRPLPFYPWLKQLASTALIDLHRRHVVALQRSIRQEIRLANSLSSPNGESILRSLSCSRPDPVARAHRRELRNRVRLAVSRLDPADQELLSLRHVRNLSVREVAVLLGVAEGTVKSRHFRALRRLRELMKLKTDDWP